MALVLRNLLVVLALVGFFGQTTVRAMPMQTLGVDSQAAVSMSAEHCAQMGEPAASSENTPAERPCEPMTGDCVAKMGCALSVMEPSRSSAADAAPVRYELVLYERVDEAHPGLSVSPELFPPIALS